MITFGSLRPAQVHISKFDPSSPKPTKHTLSVMNLLDAVSTAGSIWVRSVSHNLGLVQSYSDFYHESLVDSLSMVQLAVGPMDRPASASNTMVLSDSFVWAGTAEVETDVPATFDSDTKKGMAVYVSGSGTVDLAQADAAATTKVIGLASADVAASAIGYYAPEGQITRSDWTDITGSAALTPGVYYYLSESTPGQLTSTAPTTATQYVVAVARAFSTTQLDVEIAQPILL